MTTMDLTAFITARLDEDEAMAGAGARRVGMPWHAEDQPGTPGGLVIDDLGLVASTGGRYAADHIARHDPARVLRDVAAKRAILALATQVREWTDGSAGATAGYAAAIVSDTIRHLAAAWSDHGDYPGTAVAP